MRWSIVHQCDKLQFTIPGDRRKSGKRKPPENSGGMELCGLIATAAGITGIVGVTIIVTAARRKLGSGEGDPGEHFAGILSAAAGGIAAFLGGDGVIQNRNHQLGIPLQPNDGELPQGHEQPATVTGHHQFVIKHAANGGRNLTDRIILAVTDIPDNGVEYHGIQNLHC